MKQPDRRSFLKIAASSVGIGVLYSAYPAALAQVKGEVCSPLSAARMGSNLLPSPLSSSATHMSALTARRIHWAPKHSNVPSI
jgi:hypothetical protein